jgi:hypothetical protein
MPAAHTVAHPGQCRNFATRSDGLCDRGGERDRLFFFVKYAHRKDADRSGSSPAARERRCSIRDGVRDAYAAVVLAAEPVTIVLPAPVIMASIDAQNIAMVGDPPPLCQCRHSRYRNMLGPAHGSLPDMRELSHTGCVGLKRCTSHDDHLYSICLGACCACNSRRLPTNSCQSVGWK